MCMLTLATNFLNLLNSEYILLQGVFRIRFILIRIRFVNNGSDSESDRYNTKYNSPKIELFSYF